MRKYSVSGRWIEVAASVSGLGVSYVRLGNMQRIMAKVRQKLLNSLEFVAVTLVGMTRHTHRKTANLVTAERQQVAADGEGKV